ncbi:MAG: hypothetical protein CMM47_07095 [Rhodospirillaceae bacterium]|nr:hypothetical protein [Rhodospirillaceae bacterium]
MGLVGKSLLLVDRCSILLRVFRASVCVVILIIVAGCAETRFLTNTAKEFRDLSEKARDKGHYKVGTPYQIKGVWYYPRVDFNYDETGVASWYGPKFHNKLTANGEVFDQNEISAAHRTLPMPSIVRVINLENGRALIVRVNDRGPFAHGRIIDMSRRAAQLLGFERKGVARVRVQILPEESRAAAEMARSGRSKSKAAVLKAPSPPAVPVKSVVIETLNPVPGESQKLLPQVERHSRKKGSPSAIELTRQGKGTQLQDRVVQPTRLFVQAASFTQRVNAKRLKSKISDVGFADIYTTTLSGKSYYRVRIGPLNNVKDADQVLAQLIERGFPGARIVVE